MGPYYPGRRVQVIAAPHRKGTILHVRGSGINMMLTVALDGWHPADYRTFQVILL